MNKSLTSILIAGSVATLAACGGGDSSSSGGGTTTGAYSGVTTQATVASAGSAAKLTGTVFTNSSTFKGLGTSFSTPPQKLRAAGQTQTLNGPCGGTATMTSTDTGWSLTYNNWSDKDDSGACIAGAYMTGSIQVSTSTQNGDSSFSMVFDELKTYAPIIGLVTRVDGDMGMTMYGDGSSSYTMTMESWDKSSGTVEQYKVEGVVVKADASGNLTHLTGKFYDPVDGYFSLATTVDFDWTGCTNGAPWIGKLVLTDAGGDWTIDYGTNNCATAHVTEPNGTVHADVSIQ